MTMKTVEPLDPDAALTALVALAGHVPPGVEIGRPLIARLDEDGVVQVATGAAWWWAEEGRALRLVEVASGLELTTFVSGREVDRVFDRGLA